jgi:asparagine synthase (glutamine-hydrolysing)
MCGIFAYLGNKNNLEQNKKLYMRIQHRGPDFSVIKKISDNVTFGFHRLAIVDPNPEANQPLYLNNNSLICNGEIFNYKELIDEHKLNPLTNSDCHVLLYLYEKYGLEMINMLDAEFSFVLYDQKNNRVIAGRDQYGVRPLFIAYNDDGDVYFVSEVKAVSLLEDFTIEPFLPSHYMIYDLETKERKYVRYISCPTNIITCSRQQVLLKMKELFIKAVKKRLMSDKPIGCLLSGGLDSSLVTSIVNRNLKNLHCFSIGLVNGVDICAAKKVVKYLKIPEERHHIVNMTVEEGMMAIHDVIYHLESYDITTIRASTPQYLLAKYISKNTDIKVLYSGEGADELLAGYQYSKSAPTVEELHNDTLRLLDELYLFDNLRTDRTTAAWGLEVRVPFLDKEFTSYVLSIDPKYRKPSLEIMEKTLMRDCFRGDYLPEEILYRRKEAFSDAVSSKDKSWYKTLSGYIEKIISDEELLNAKSKYLHNPPLTKEALYYRNIFQELYPNRDKLISHYWMPKWQGDITDPSATVLKCHKGDLEIKY